MPKQARNSIPGVIQTTVQLPEYLHQMMKSLRIARRRLEHGDVHLCRLYQEAVEYYLAAKPQRQLLEPHVPTAEGSQALTADMDETLCAVDSGV